MRPFTLSPEIPWRVTFVKQLGKDLDYGENGDKSGDSIDLGSLILIQRNVPSLTFTAIYLRCLLRAKFLAG